MITHVKKGADSPGPGAAQRQRARVEDGKSAQFAGLRPESTAQREMEESLNRRPAVQLQVAMARQLNRKPEAAETAAQLVIENATYRGDESDQELAAEFFQSYDDKVQEAYEYAVTVPSLHAYSDLNGRTQHWCNLWKDHLSGKKPKLMAAAFGYVVESLVTATGAPYAPSAPKGCLVTAQEPSGGTRPDVVLRLSKGDDSVAWLDLTASDSADHIFDKEGWDKKVKNYAEVTYPSLDGATLALMLQNKDNKGAVSKEEFQKRLIAANEEYQKRKKAWQEIGSQFRISSKLGKKLYRNSWFLNPGLGQHAITEALKQAFGLSKIDIKLVPSILAAMGVNAGPYGFLIGTSQSERAGEAWLLDNQVDENSKIDVGKIDVKVEEVIEEKNEVRKLRTRRTKNPYKSMDKKVTEEKDTSDKRKRVTLDSAGSNKRLKNVDTIDENLVGVEEN